MAYLINDDCTACGICITECPNDAISEGDPIYVINPALCTECVGFYDEPQCVSVCPVEAIQLDPDHKESKEALLEKKKKIHGES
jgi:ferredoxin